MARTEAYVMRIRQISESAFTVQGHGVHTAFTELCDALRQYTSVTLLVNERGRADVTHIHTVGSYALSYLLFASGKKVVSAHIVPESLRGSLVGASLWMPIARWYLRWFYNRADVVLAVSDATKKELRAMGVKTRVEVVYNIVNAEKYQTSSTTRQRARQKLGIKERDWLVVGSGQVQPRKRVDSFIKAAAQCPDMTFIWVGGMPFGKLAADNSGMQHAVADAPSNVLFTGVIAHQDVAKYYQAADVFWLPSSQETFGMVVVEAAAAGLPVVLRDIPDYRETFAGLALQADETGFVPLLRQLRDEPAFYADASRKSRAIVERFSAKKIVTQILAVYKAGVSTRD